MTQTEPTKHPSYLASNHCYVSNFWTTTTRSSAYLSSFDLSRVHSLIAAPTPACKGEVDAEGNLTKRCNIPWTRNYGEYEEKRDLKERACKSEVA
jgi:hypothetical protein